MRNLFIIIVFSLVGTVMFGQQRTSSFRLISKADFVALERHMAEEVELITPNHADFFTRAQALRLLKEAIIKIKPVSWKERHIGGTRGGASTYSVGHIKSSSGQNFRLYIVKERLGGSSKIVSIEIEQQ